MSATTQRVRRLGSDDLAAIEDLEARSFGSPWSSEDLAEELADAHSVCLGAEEGTALRGFLIVFCRRSPVGRLWHIANLAVDPEHRRRGIATLLLERFFETVADQPGAFGAEIGVSNLACLALAKRFGFEARRLLPGRYQDDGESVWALWRDS